MELLEKKEIKTSFRFRVEKLDGGFISDITGKRKIFKDGYEIDEAVDLRSLLNRVEDAEYHLNIDLIHKDHYQDHLSLQDIQQKEELTIADGLERGIIEAAEEFNPNISSASDIVEKDITVNEHTAYKAGRLKSIDWTYFDEQLPLTNADRSEISGMSSQAMYNQFRKAKQGKASFHLMQTRIGFTILAKYYESNLGLRSSTKDQMDKMKDDVLVTLRALELMAGKAKFVYSSEINKKIEEMRKQLGV